MKRFTIFFTLFCVLMLSSVSFAQYVNVDFETGGLGASWPWIVGENDDNPPLEFIANPVSGGINTSATVAKFTARVTGNPWALCITDSIADFMFDATNSTIKIMVYKPEISPVGIKFEGVSAPVQIDVSNTVTNQWEELTFDFSGSIGNTYGKIVIIPDNQARTQENIIYFDNIQLPQGNVGPEPEPTTPAPTPTHPASNVISIYSNAYNNVPGTNYNPLWGQSTVVTVNYVVAGDSVLKYENLNYQGTEFTNQDVSTYDFLHVDFWTPNAASLDFYLISPGPVEVPYSFPITTEQWVSVDIALSSFSPVNLADVFQFKVVGNGTVYFDNWYFYKSANSVEEVQSSGPVKFELQQNYPNPFNPNTNIRFSLPKAAHVTLKVYDVIGQEVATLVDNFKNAGTFEVDFNAANLPSGSYFYTISTGNFNSTRKMLLIK